MESQENVSPSGAVSPTAEENDAKKADYVAYQIKPSLENKFKEEPAKEIIRTVLTDTLHGKTYNADLVKKWTITIANEVNEKIKELHLKSYKHIVQVILGEMRGAGVRSGVRCIWDSDTDGYTSEVFMNDTIFCVTTVFAVYMY